MVELGLNNCENALGGERGEGGWQKPRGQNEGERRGKGMGAVRSKCGGGGKVEGGIADATGARISTC